MALLQDLGPVPPAPKPTVVVIMEVCPGPGGGMMFQDATLEITHMPGGFLGAHTALCLALGKIAETIATGTAPRGVVQVATRLPDGKGLVR